MSDEVRNELTPKYREIYNKAKTGHSPKSAIKVVCLLCMVCKTKDIENCENEGCALHQYRPYQEKPYKFRRRTTALISEHYVRGKKVKNRKKYPTSVTKVIDIPKSLSGRVRLTVGIEQEPKK